MRCYATLNDARNALKAEITSSANDAMLMNNLRQLTLRVDRLLFPFEPVLKTKTVLVRSWLVNSYDRTLQLPVPLLELSGMTLNGTALTPTTDVMLWPPTTTPVKRLRLTDSCESWYTVVYADDVPVEAAITGFWGMHPEYSMAWQVVDTLAVGINATVTDFTVTDADGMGAEGETPRFSPGNLIKVDSEFMRVLAVNTTTNTLTVRRGENGTTAAVHSITAPVLVWYWTHDVRFEVARQAALLYARRGAFEAVSVMNDGVYTYPPDLLYALQNVLSVYDHWEY